MNIRRLAAWFVCCLTAAGMWASPARHGWQTKTLEDGTTVRVQQMGDEYYHYWVTENGKQAIETAKGLRLSDEAAPSPEEAAKRRAKAAEERRAPQTIGVIKLPKRILVILAGYTDLPYQASNDSASMWAMLNQTGYDYDPGKGFHATGSARDYFIAQSDSLYKPDFDVVGPIVLPNNRKYYGEPTSSKSDKNAIQMIVDACKAVDDKVDFTKYNNDGDTNIDAVIVLFAGIGQNDINGEADAIWPHNSSAAGANCKLDGLLLDTYACSGEINGLDHTRNGIGTICHEFGHVIGMPDYYDTNSSTNFKETLTPNDWSVMDVGSYNNNVNTPPNYSIFDKYYMGWAKPKFIAKDAQCYIRMGTGYKDAYQITGGSSLQPYSCTDTVYYVENRQPVGWDKYLPGHGMLVWRVVYSSSIWSNNKPNNTAYKPRYAVVAADGSQQTGTYYHPDQKVHDGKTDPFPGAADIHAFNPFAGCALTEITEADGKISFLFNGGKSECDYTVMPEQCNVSVESGNLNAGQPLELIITPETGYTLADEDCWAVEMGETNELLVYGKDFTYDPATHIFRLARIMDNVTIIVQAKEDSPAGMSNSEDGTIRSKKVVRNGQLLIIHNGKTYNTLGQTINNN